MQIEYSAADVELFWSRVDKNGPVPAHQPELGPCWIWTRARAVAGGYGIFGPSLKRVYRAHRFAWTVTNGEIPAGLFLCHACDNPPCVRPSHLFLGDAKANMQDCVSKGRHAMQQWTREQRRAYAIEREAKKRHARATLE